MPNFIILSNEPMDPKPLVIIQMKCFCSVLDSVLLEEKSFFFSFLGEKFHFKNKEQRRAFFGHTRTEKQKAIKQ
jgi:hypothetical protein